MPGRFVDDGLPEKANVEACAIPKNHFLKSANYYIHWASHQ